MGTAPAVTIRVRRLYIFSAYINIVRYRAVVLEIYSTFTYTRINDDDNNAVQYKLYSSFERIGAVDGVRFLLWGRCDRLRP